MCEYAIVNYSNDLKSSRQYVMLDVEKLPNIIRLNSEKIQNFSFKPKSAIFDETHENDNKFRDFQELCSFANF